MSVYNDINRLLEQEKVNIESAEQTNYATFPTPAPLTALEECVQKQRVYDDMTFKLREVAMCFTFNYEGNPYQLNLAINKDHQLIYWVDSTNSRKEPLSETQQLAIAGAFSLSAVVSNMLSGQGVATKILATAAGSSLLKPLSFLTTGPALILSSTASYGLTKFDEWCNTDVMPSSLPGLTLGTSIVGIALSALLIKKGVKSFSQGKLGGCCPSVKGLIDWWKTRNSEEKFSDDKITLISVGNQSAFSSKEVQIALSRNSITREFFITLFIGGTPVSKQPVVTGPDDDEDEEDEEEKIKKEKKVAQSDIFIKPQDEVAEISIQIDPIENAEISKIEEKSIIVAEELLLHVEKLALQELEKVEKKKKKKKNKVNKPKNKTQPPSGIQKAGVIGALTTAVALSEYFTGQGIATTSIVGLEAMLLKLEARNSPLANSLATLTLCGVLLAAPRYYVAPWLSLEVIPLAAAVSLLRKHIKDRVTGKPTKNPYLVQLPESVRKLLWNAFSVLPSNPLELPLNESTINELHESPGNFGVNLPDETGSPAKLKVVSGMPRLFLKQEKKVKEKQEKCTTFKEGVFIAMMTALSLASSYLTQQQAPTGIEPEGEAQAQNQGEGVLTGLLYSAVPTCVKQMCRKLPLSVSYASATTATALGVALENYLAEKGTLPLRFSFIPTGILTALLTKNLKTWNRGKGYGSDNDPILNYLSEVKGNVKEFFCCLAQHADTPEQAAEIKNSADILIQAIENKESEV